MRDLKRGGGGEKDGKPTPPRMDMPLNRTVVPAIECAEVGAYINGLQFKFKYEFALL